MLQTCTLHVESTAQQLPSCMSGKAEQGDQGSEVGLTQHFVSFIDDMHAQIPAKCDQVDKLQALILKRCSKS